jgi:DNA polymerase (family 10)
MDHFGRFPDVADVIARGETKMSVRLTRGFQVDLRVVPAESFGAALQYFTGSKDHNVVLRGMAKQRGLKINEYGVYRVEKGRDVYIAGADEEAVYAALDLPCFPPELREARREFAWAEAGALPELVRTEDIRGDVHMHTTETDGRNSLEEMVQAARNRGLKYIAITDHSQRVTMARGLDPERLLAQWEEIDRLNEQLGKRFTVLKGIECDILEKGGMDLPDDVLAQADWVIASIHYGQRQPREQITGRIVDALANPHVSVIAHPTGRLIDRREAYEVDLDTVFAAAAEHGKMLELNANPMRLDLNDVYCAAAKSHGIPIVITTDAHDTEGLDDMRYGVLQARRGGLTKSDVANTRTWPQMKKLLGKRKK